MSGLGAFVNGLKEGYEFREGVDARREARENNRVDRQRRIGREDRDEEFLGATRKRQRRDWSREDEEYDAEQEALRNADQAAREGMNGQPEISGGGGTDVVVGSSRDDRLGAATDDATLNLLARTLMAEAGGEGYDGMLAAGAVINNRVASGRYGSGIEGVIMRPGQFSAWNGVTGYAGGEGALDMDSIQPNAAALRAAEALISGNYEDPTGGATHYYNDAVANPAWGEKRAGGDWLRIGNHIFGSADAGSGRPAPQTAPPVQQAAAEPAPAPRGVRRPPAATIADTAARGRPTMGQAAQASQPQPEEVDTIGRPGRFVVDGPRLPAAPPSAPIQMTAGPVGSPARVYARAQRLAQQQALAAAPQPLGARRMA